MTGKSQEAMTLYFDRLQGCKVTDVRKDGGCLISYCLIQIYTLLLGCQPKSWRTIFSGPKGKLAILNLQLNIE